MLNENFCKLLETESLLKPQLHALRVGNLLLIGLFLKEVVLDTALMLAGLHALLTEGVADVELQLREWHTDVLPMAEVAACAVGLDVDGSTTMDARNG